MCSFNGEMAVAPPVSYQKNPAGLYRFAIQRTLYLTILFPYFSSVSVSKGSILLQYNVIFVEGSLFWILAVQHGQVSCIVFTIEILVIGGNFKDGSSLQGANENIEIHDEFNPNTIFCPRHSIATTGWLKF
jgi:hypothetical protein